MCVYMYLCLVQRVLLTSHLYLYVKYSHLEKSGRRCWWDPGHQTWCHIGKSHSRRPSGWPSHAHAYESSSSASLQSSLLTTHPYPYFHHSGNSQGRGWLAASPAWHQKGCMALKHPSESREQFTNPGSSGKWPINQCLSQREHVSRVTDVRSVQRHQLLCHWDNWT